MLVKNLWFLCALATLTFLVMAETSATDEPKVDKVSYKKLKTFDSKAKGKKLEFKKVGTTEGKDAGDGFEITPKPIMREHKLVRVRLEKKDRRNGERNLLPTVEEDERNEDRSQGYEGRFKRNATMLNDLKGSKKGHKKLKPTQAQAGYKNWKGKERSGDSIDDKYVDKTKKKVVRRRVDRFEHDKVGKVRSKRYAVTRSFRNDRTDYYAQRKAVMERFYARQKEIAEKYARKMSTTPKYVHRYDTINETENKHFSTSNKTDTNNVDRIENAVNGTESDFENSNRISTSTEAYTEAHTEVNEATSEGNRKGTINGVRVTESSAEDNIEEDTSDDYDYYTLEDNKVKQIPDALSEDNGTLNDGEWEEDDSRRDTLKWGNCAGKLVYQHNLIIGVHKAALADADLATSVEGPFCVTCIRVVPANENKATVSLDVNRREDGSLGLAKLAFKGFQDEELSYIVKIWAVSRKDNRCDHV